MSSIERPNCYTAEEWKKVKGKRAIQYRFQTIQ